MRLARTSGAALRHDACLEEQGLKFLPLSLEGLFVKSEIPPVQVGAPLALMIDHISTGIELRA